jgi:hydroxymethylpyrimidine/phosphomethylpyrimidine kinase
MRAAVTPASQPSALPAALSIAGSDSGAGAGVQADLLTFAAHGVYGTTAITCLTAQNPDGVTSVHAGPPEFVLQQIESVLCYFPVRAAKTGMLLNTEIVAAVAKILTTHRRIPLVIDPVMVATSGAVLLREDAIRAMTEHLFPLGRVITPNLDEGAVLLGRRPESHEELIEAAVTLSERYGTSVLLKGGHLHGRRLTDVLASPGSKVRVYEGTRIAGVDTHGSGCTLSAAIAANLALGRDLPASVERARRYLRQGMTRPLRVAGRNFIAH